MVEQTKQFFSKNIASTRDDFVKDIEAMSTDLLSNKPGEADRCAFDLIYEVALINRRFAKRIKGETPDKLPSSGFIKAPEDYRDKAAALNDIKTSFDAVLSAWESINGEDLFREIKLESGETSSPFEYAYITCYHGGYHDGQLNLLQSINGDQAVHWG